MSCSRRRRNASSVGWQSSLVAGRWTRPKLSAISFKEDLQADVSSSNPSPVTRCPSPTSIFVLLASLVDQSLVTIATAVGGEPRYQMLETIREFGLERLEPDEEVTARSEHARYFLDLAWSLRPLVYTLSTWGPLGRLAADDGNLRAALEWLEANGQPTDFARMVSASYTYMFARSHFR